MAIYISNEIQLPLSIKDGVISVYLGDEVIRTINTTIPSAFNCEKQCNNFYCRTGTMLALVYINSYTIVIRKDGFLSIYQKGTNKFITNISIEIVNKPYVITTAELGIISDASGSAGLSINYLPKCLLNFCNTRTGKSFVVRYNDELETLVEQGVYANKRPDLLVYIRYQEKVPSELVINLPNFNLSVPIKEYSKDTIIYGG